MFVVALYANAVHLGGPSLFSCVFRGFSGWVFLLLSIFPAACFASRLAFRFADTVCVLWGDLGYYRQEQRQREDSTGVLSGSFINWHRQRKLHPTRKAPELVTSDLTHVLSCRFWYECHDGYCGQMALLFLPHHDPEFLLPRSWAHLVFLHPTLILVISFDVSRSFTSL